MPRLLLSLCAAALCIAPAMAEDWVPVREISLEYGAGSPLDFTAIMPNAAISDANRLVVADGHFAHANAPARPQPLFCATLAWGPASGGFPDHQRADRYAKQLAMRGYNIARFHFTDAAMMFGRSGDFDYDPEQLDRLHYLLAALKREGIAWMFDGLSSWRGGFGGYDDRWDVPDSDLKLSVLIEPQGLDHWTRLVGTLLGGTNPYTGMSTLADPALSLLVLVNEGSVEFDSVVRERPGLPLYSQKLEPLFVDWLRQRYADDAALAKAWGGLSPGESLAQGRIDLPAERYGDAPRLGDLQRFFTELEIGGTARMTEAVRAKGYRGAITNYNNWPTDQVGASRAGLDASAMNVYFDWVPSYAMGEAITQQSSLANSLDYLRIAAGTRWLGKPFLLTEYDHMFWNRYRYEAGLAVPAYAAFQGWDGLCRHAHDAIVLRYGEDVPHKRQILPYAIALDPVARAGETLAALLFRRGDVDRASQDIGIPAPDPETFGPDLQAGTPDEVTRLISQAAIGLSAKATAMPAAPEWAETYSSDTGQLVLTPGRNRLTLVTARTVAAAFDTLDQALALGPLTIAPTGEQALLALSSLDGRALTESQRMLIVMATDARNTDMRFADADARVIADYGHLPAVIRRAMLDVTIEGAGRWRLSPIGLDGTVHKSVARGEGPVAVTLDNAPASGPTTYFLLERL